MAQTGTTGTKDNTFKKPNGHGNDRLAQQRRRESAAERQAAHNGLSLDEKIAKARAGSREWNRLMAQKAKAA